MRFSWVLVLGLLTAPAMADEAADAKAESCGYQGDVVAAVQQARIDRVRERRVAEHIAAQDYEWPEQYNGAIPLITPWIYEMRRADLDEDLRAVWIAGCMAQ